MDYAEARAIAETGKAIILSNTGGRKRYGRFTLSDDVVSVTLFSTTIAKFYPDYAIFRRGGYDTATTRECLNILFPAGLRAWADRDHVWRFHKDGQDGIAFYDGININYDGTIQERGNA